MATYVAFVCANYLKIIKQNRFPGVFNEQCVIVRHDYSHYYVLAIIVVCIVAPI
mgnify:CR=1 FL=1